MITLALIGTGAWGSNIKRTLEGISDVNLVTSNSAGATKKLLKRDDLNGVLIATPGSTHAKVALPFIEKGIPTYIEKPFTTSLKDAKKLQKAADLALRSSKSEARVMVGHIHLYNPAYQKAKEALVKAGPIRAIYIEGMNNGPFRDDMSALWDWSPHDVAMAIDIMGKSPQTVQAWGVKTLRPRTKLYDMVHLKLTFARNVHVLITNGWLSAQKFKWMNVIGTKDTIIYDDVKQKQKVVIYKGMGPQPVTISRDGKHTTRILKRKPKIEHPRYGSSSPLEAELKAFIKLIKTDEKPASDLKHAMDVVQILDAAERSMDLDGKVVKI